MLVPRYSVRPCARFLPLDVSPPIYALIGGRLSYPGRSVADRKSCATGRLAELTAMPRPGLPDVSQPLRAIRARFQACGNCANPSVLADVALHRAPVSDGAKAALDVDHLDCRSSLNRPTTRTRQGGS